MTSLLNEDGLMLFALNGSRPFGELVARQLGVTLAAHDEREFEDGEHKARPLVSVRGRDVYVIHSLYADSAQSGEGKLCRLLFFIGALKDAAAARVTAVVPYLAYARKDQRTKPRDPVVTRYVAAMFEAVGADAVLTLDVHNLSAFQNAFRCRTEHLEATRMFVAWFAPLLKDRDAVVLSPDAGGIKRAEHFRVALAEALGKPVGMAFAEKHRSGGVVSGDLLVGEVAGKHAVIVDDLVSSGTTMTRAARACIERGAAGVMGAATHGLFTGDASAVLADSELQQLVVTDTVPPFRLEHSAAQTKVRVLSCSGLFAKAIARMHAGESVSALMAPGR
ncbi:ribose-phosphate pyrophosphokinase [Massilia sp. R2A-15]|uniref:ribose-phosphate diphosphokinase n=1 Tax=Massilia sp. R2A-15 TaxID=3064278 RepID=UPI0027341749|nr:ribose-phosphate pyrophosphokinase [Massilia sp. R2A-15]WLI90293.1 ribose-phosphate pyrophosphokinase [Massilia sp. R2A-15]